MGLGRHVRGLLYPSMPCAVGVVLANRDWFPRWVSVLLLARKLIFTRAQTRVCCGFVFHRAIGAVVASCVAIYLFQTSMFAASRIAPSRNRPNICRVDASARKRPPCPCKICYAISR